jgi:predicted nucleic acid-binding Zn ribbon protein
MDQSSELDLMKSIIDKIFKDGSESQSNSFEVSKIQRAWNEIVGDQPGSFTKPYAIWDGVLYVGCSHQGWVQTLQFQKDKILSGINEKKVTDIELKDIFFKFSDEKTSK